MNVLVKRSSVWICILEVQTYHFSSFKSLIYRLVSLNIMNSVFVFLVIFALVGLFRNAEANPIQCNANQCIIYATLEKSPQMKSKQNLINVIMQLVNDRVPAYLHNRPAFDHFLAIRPDSHSTISLFVWYLPLKNWNLYYIFADLLAIWPFLRLTDPTRIWPNDICIEPYSTI